MNVVQNYYKNALLDDLCSEYKGLWQRANGNKLELLKLSLCQQSIPHVVTFAYQGKGITKDYALREFKDYINGYTVENADGVNGYTYGLYVDFDCREELVAKQDVVSVMWTKGATVIIPQTKATILYVSNKSDVSLVCNGYNSVKIYLFDKSKVTLEDVDEDSHVIIYNYSDSAKVKKGKYCLSRKIKEFHKQLKL